MIDSIISVVRDSEANEEIIDPNKLISGHDKTEIWPSFTDAKNQFHVGHWSSGVCKLNVRYSETELCVMVAGEAILTDDVGESKTFVKGDAFVIPSGFQGTWESITPVIKIFAVYDLQQE